MTVALECFGINPPPVYLACVADLQSMFVCNPPYERPSSSPGLAPFDQASQRPRFGPAEDRGSPEDFLAWACKQPHLGNESPSLPPDLEAAIVHVWSMGRLAAIDRQTRLDAIRRIANVLEPLSVELCKSMSSAAVRVARAMMLNVMRRSEPGASLADVSERLYCPHYAMWCAVLDSMRWPHYRLVADMARGFRSVGDIPDTGLFRADEQPAGKTPHEFAASNAAWASTCKQRVLSRARRDPEIANACWQRTMQECSDGLISGPFSSSQLDAPRSRGYPAFGFGKYRPLPRHAIWQGGKYRCIDDARVSGSNRDGTTAHERLVCDRPDSPLRIGVRFHELGPPPRDPHVRVNIGTSTNDAFAAYRRCVTCDEEYTVVCVAEPFVHEDNGDPDYRAVFFRVPGHNFGLLSAVLNWNAIPAPVCAFSRRALAVPVTNYYDDDQATEPSYSCAMGGLGVSAGDAHFELHELLRFHFDLGKRRGWSPRRVYLGVCTDWTWEASGWATIGVTRDRREKVRSLVAGFLADRCMSATDASVLRGKSRFSVCPVFGRTGLAIVHLLRMRQRDHESTEIGAALEDALSALDMLLELLPNFAVPLVRDPRPTLVILTDASWERNSTWLGFLVCCPWNGARWAGCPTPPWLLDLLERHRRRETYIGQIEQAVIASPYLSLPASWLRGRNVLHFVDNQGALYGTIHGRSDDRDMNRLIFVTRLNLDALACNAWFDYVPSASNIADLPTRLDAAAFARLERIADRVPLVLPPEWCLECDWSALRQLFV